MLYVWLSLLLILTALVVARIRIRLEIAPRTRLLAVKLGRSGPEFDMVGGGIVVRLFGRRVWRIAPKPAKVRKHAPARSSAPQEQRSASLAYRIRLLRQALRVVPRCLSAIFRFVIAGIKSAVVEQAECEIRGGFANPALTGQVYGFYQAALATAPGFFRRVNFNPDWTVPTMSGTVRVTVAWPVYRLVWETAVLLTRLPLR
ncbi:MAG: hypothetical protein AB1772_13080, partial [Candidatus Zixiibacteriota bacterium]